MRSIPARIHGALVDLMGIALLAVLWGLALIQGGPQAWLPVTLGASVVVSGLLTAYELSLAKLIPMPVHLGRDIGGTNPRHGEPLSADWRER